MSQIKKILCYIFFATIIGPQAHAVLNICLCEKRAFAKLMLEATQKKLDYALFAANGRDWYLDNILFSNASKSVYIYFAPGDVVCFNSKWPIGETLEIGLEKAIDYLANQGDTLYLALPRGDDDIKKAAKDKIYLDNIMRRKYEANFFSYFVRMRYSDARFGDLDMEAAKRLVRFDYVFTDKYPYGSVYKDNNKFYAYPSGVKPIADDHAARRADYTEADINHYLELRFNRQDFYTDTMAPEYSIPLLEYRPTRLNTGQFQFLESRFYHLQEDSLSGSLTLAVYPPSIDSLAILKSKSMINQALYDANGRDWYVNHILFGSRLQSSLFFTAGRNSVYKSWEEPDSSFVIGMSRALDLLALRNDTLFIPLRDWDNPYCEDEKILETIGKWQDQLLTSFLLGADWKTKIQTGRIGVAALEYGEHYNPIGFQNIRLWPRLDNGTESGRVFRNGYERSCRDRGLNKIDETEIGRCQNYTDTDINLYLEWIRMADDYYTNLPAPSVYHIMDFDYPHIAQIPLARLTVREVCKQ